MITSSPPADQGGLGFLRYSCCARTRASPRVGARQHAATVAAEVAAEVTVAEVAIKITTPCQLATRCNIHRYEKATAACGHGGLTFKIPAASKRGFK